jgi:hypothetical protein
MLFAVLLIAAQQCWFSDGWHGSGYYDCRFGPWQRDEQTVEPPRRYKHEQHVLAEHEIEAAALIMKRAWWP